MTMLEDVSHDHEKKLAVNAVPGTAPEDNPNSHLLPELGVKVLSTTAVSKQLSRRFYQ